MVTVEQVERLGAETIVISRVNGHDGRLVARVGGDVAAVVGETTAMSAPLTSCHIFDSDGNAVRELIPQE